MVVVNWWYGRDRDIREFVKPNCYAIKKYMEGVEDALEVAEKINMDFFYPIDSAKQPACGKVIGYWNKFPVVGLLRRGFNRVVYGSCPQQEYQIVKKFDYTWLDVEECLDIRSGICIDTALLAASCLRSLGLEAYCEAGYVTFEGDGNQYGHAWAIFKDEEGVWWLIETTIHDGGRTNNVIERDTALNGFNGVRYHPTERWNEEKHEILGSSLGIMHGIAPEAGGKKLEEWKKLEFVKQVSIWDAWAEDGGEVNEDK